MLIVPTLGFSISAMVPEGPSPGTRAELSTMVTSPPPTAEAGLIFMAGVGRLRVCKLADDLGPLLALLPPLRKPKKSSSTLARAIPGESMPRTMSDEIKRAPVRAVRDELYVTLCGFLKPALGSRVIPLISQFHGFLSALARKSKGTPLLS